MKRCFIVGVLAITLAGCAKNSSNDFVTESEFVTEEVNNSVKLDSIKAPKFEEDFATLCGNRDLPLYWGSSSTTENGIVWEDSGYPGFDYPIVITIDYDESSPTIKIITSWGQYEYEYKRSFNAYKDANQLVTWTGSNLLRWGKSGESLFLWNKEGNRCSKYDLVEGTKIVF